MKRLCIFLPHILVFTLLVTPIISLAGEGDIDKEIQEKLEEIEESIKDIKIPEIDIPDIPEIDIDLDDIETRVKVIEDIFDEDFPYRIERKILTGLRFPGEDIASFLDLDEATEKNIKDMQLKHKEEMIDLRSKIEKLELDIERILMEDKLDTRKLLSKYKEISKFREEMAVKKIEYKINIYNLIPEDKKEDAKDIFFHRHPHIKLLFKDLGNLKEFREGMLNFKESINEFKENMKESAKKIAEKYKQYQKI